MPKIILLQIRVMLQWKKTLMVSKTVYRILRVRSIREVILRIVILAKKLMTEVTMMKTMEKKKRMSLTTSKRSKGTTSSS